MREPKSTGINLVTRSMWSLWNSEIKMVCTLVRPTPCCGWEAIVWLVVQLIWPWVLLWMPKDASRSESWKQPSNAPWLNKWSHLLGYIGKVIASCVSVLVMASLLQGAILYWYFDICWLWKGTYLRDGAFLHPCICLSTSICLCFYPKVLLEMYLLYFHRRPEKRWIC